MRNFSKALYSRNQKISTEFFTLLKTTGWFLICILHMVRAPGRIHGGYVVTYATTNHLSNRPRQHYNTDCCRRPLDPTTILCWPAITTTQPHSPELTRGLSILPGAEASLSLRLFGFVVWEAGRWKGGASRRLVDEKLERRVGELSQVSFLWDKTRKKKIIWDINKYGLNCFWVCDAMKNERFLRLSLRMFYINYFIFTKFRCNEFSTKKILKMNS